MAIHSSRALAATETVVNISHAFMLPHLRPRLPAAAAVHVRGKHIIGLTGIRSASRTSSVPQLVASSTTMAAGALPQQQQYLCNSDVHQLLLLSSNAYAPVPVCNSSVCVSATAPEERRRQKHGFNISSTHCSDSLRFNSCDTAETTGTLATAPALLQ